MSRTVPRSELEAFRHTVLGWYAGHRRDLPWRRTRDPYRVLVSEVMLQQTQVTRVIDKYAEFVSAFPTVQALAAAPLAEVLRVWSGLGYNRRARSLKAAAETIVAEHGGRVPDTLETLVALPGVGHATAAQVLSFAFGTGVPFIETNIRAVYLHHFFPGESDVPDAEVLPLVAATLDADDPREWYYALMDYGTWLKKTVPNPSRASRHHASQSRFEGSPRQARGAVLRALIAVPGLDVAGIAAETGVDEERIARAVAALMAEGFLAADGGRLRIV